MQSSPVILLAVVCGFFLIILAMVAFVIYAAGVPRPTALDALVVGLGALYGAIAALAFRLLHGPAGAP